MKITKFRFAVSVLLIATVIYGVMYVVEENHYYSQIEEHPDHPKLGKLYVSLESFGETQEGKQFFIIGLGFIALWCLAIYPPNLWRRKKAVALMLLLPLSLMMLNFKPVSAEPVSAESEYFPDICIDILMAGDEEFMADPNNIHDVAHAIHRANTFTVGWLELESFESLFGIHFRIVRWVTWESDNDDNVAENMMWHAWNQIGFETGMHVCGRTIEMLVVLTGQDIYGYHACTAPDANISLFETYYAKSVGAIRHEFSHQFYAEECDSICVLNQDEALDTIFPIWDWCHECTDWINAHKDKWADDNGGGGNSGDIYMCPY